MTEPTIDRIELRSDTRDETRDESETRGERRRGARGDGDRWSVFVAGDCALWGETPTDPIGDEVRERVSKANVSLVNLEGVIPDGAATVDKYGPVRSTDPATPSLLADAGFDAATLANNHVMDYGERGMEATVTACRDAGLETVGAGVDAARALAPLRLSVGDATLAVVNLCEREFGAAEATRPGTAWISDPRADRAVANAAETADVVLVVAHGGLEYTPIPPQQRQLRLRALVDAGADAVIGHHPHVPQGWEVYEGAPICYSLGNFHYHQRSRPNTQWGLGVELVFDGASLAGVDLFPTEIVDGVVRPLGTERPIEPRLDYLRRSSEVIADRERLRAHWQELAVRIFAQRYASWLRAGTASGPLQALRDPLAAAGRTTFDPESRQTELMGLLNIIRNESHRDAIETALALKTGEARDARTPEVERDVRELLSWTEDQAVYDRPSGLRRTLSALLRAVRK
jgi:poly-gamma-glutamate synthesis protein (capsule biosynthesis protein)